MRLISFANIPTVPCTGCVCVQKNLREIRVAQCGQWHSMGTADKAIPRDKRIFGKYVLSDVGFNLNGNVPKLKLKQTCREYAGKWEWRKPMERGMMRWTRKMFELWIIIRQMDIDHTLSHTHLYAHMSAWWLCLSITKSLLSFDYFVRIDAGSLNLLKS